LGKAEGAPGVRRILLPDAQEAFDAAGYERSAITPFGSTGRWSVVADIRLTTMNVMSIGGGDHGVSATLAAHALVDVLVAERADITRDAVRP
jgi:Cys-tRNA(Pro)/Cys-tRNA(Cys) deacylase